ncbi:unnamed protein product [Cercopithifilaria johnstoni]|uniref:Uncharacterized protein n=1 Tax=Cercopithifilaria johnstoni TaxID=2874296 RepID=A0A8J2MQL2_9BILA|nr:unnamed protein product [Cercopithifilaria johnstoni]
MNGEQNDNPAHCSLITFIKKGYDVIKRFVIRKSIQLNDDNAIPVASDRDIPVIADDSDLLSSVESQQDFLFDIRSGPINFSSQLLNQEENDSKMIVISDTEIGLHYQFLKTILQIILLDI